MSLDALRGFDMFWIIGTDEVLRIVGRLTGQQWISDQMEHVAWEGLRLHDVIFPLFIFIMGVSLVFSLGKTIREHGRGEAVKRVVRRSVILYALGFIASGGLGNEWADIHFCGVLNRIGLAYFFTGMIFCGCWRQGAENFLEGSSSSPLPSPLGEGESSSAGLEKLNGRQRWRGMAAWAVVLLGGYWAVMTFAPMRDIRLNKESLEGEGKPAMAVFLSTTNWTRGKFEQGYNVANQIDYLYLPGFKGHGYYDPDGLLTTVPVVVTCLLGVFAGLLLQSGNFYDKWKLIYLVALGAAGILAGLLWSLQFPIVKRLWSPSFVLVTGGISSILLGLFYWLVDVKQWRWWCQPFVWIGMNSVTIYFSRSLLDFTRVGARFTSSHHELLAAITGTLLGILLCRFLYVRKIFLRI